MRVPDHTPLGVVEVIKDLIEGKIVCDVGCGTGEFMKELDKYALKVFGIEENEILCNSCANQGLSVYNTNAFFEPLPEADVYYIWTRDVMGLVMKAQFEGTHGTFILGHTVRPSTLKFFESLNPQIRCYEDFKLYIINL